MGFRDRYSVDKKQAEEGTWVNLGDDIQIKIRRMNSKMVRDTLARLQRPHSALISSGRPLPTDISQSINVRLIAQAVLLGWKGVPDMRVETTEGEDSTPLPFTEDNAVTVLTENLDFLADIVEASTNIDNFRKEEVAALTGNS